MSVIGWSFLKAQNAEIAYPLLFVENEKGETVKKIFCARVARVDVQRSFKDDKVGESSGFTAAFSTNDLAKGTYAVYLLLMDNNVLVKQKINNTVEID